MPRLIPLIKKGFGDGAKKECIIVVPNLKTNVNKIRIKIKKATLAIAELDSKKSAVPETNLLFLNESNKSSVVCFKLPATEVKF